MSDAPLVNEDQQAIIVTPEANECDEPGQRESNSPKEEPTADKPHQDDDPCPAPSETSQGSIEQAQMVQEVKVVQSLDTNGKKKNDDDKSTIYKALAIKLKKELVKTRDELSKVREEYKRVVDELKTKVECLEVTLEAERVLSTNMTTTLEASVKNLKSQLEVAENDLQSLQAEFDSYKTRATKIMQQNNPLLSNTNKSFEEDRCKQLKTLSEDQKRQIKDLNAQVETISNKNKELEEQIDSFTCRLNLAQEQIDSYKSLESKYNKLSTEHESLKSSLKHNKEKHLKNESKANTSKHIKMPTTEQLEGDCMTHSTKQQSDLESPTTGNDDENTNHISPSNSDKDDNQTNSSSSLDSSAYGYVHIKPTAFEIISRTSVLEDAQKQIDNLTKAYLDSESTNSLLTEQVSALKEEIRRIQRGNERMELANNLEYLKNVIFKFLSLDNGQIEQKQRLVPVLSTILKLSPEETSKLNSLALTEKGIITSSFFKF